MITHPAVHDLFWDDNWNHDNPAFQQADVASKVGELVHSTYLNAAQQYGVQTPTTTGEDASSSLCPFRSAGSSVDPFKLTLWITCEAGGGPWADTEVPGTGGIQGLPLLDGLPTADDNTDYVIFLPKGSSVGLFSLRSCKSNGGKFDDFHFFTVVSQIQWGSFLGIPMPNIEYQTVPYIVAPVDCSDGTVAGLVDGVSHELVESATDPLVGLGWIENNQFSFTDPTKIFMDGETSDICEKAGNGSSATFGGLSVERYWSNQDNACVPRSDCSAPRLLKRSLPPPRTLTLKPPVLHSAGFAALRGVRAFAVRGSVRVRAYGPGSPRASSDYTIEQQGPGRALFEGRTKIDGGPTVSFAIVQVGSRRCARGRHRWVCQDNMPALDARTLVADLMRRPFATPSRTVTAHGLSTIRTTHANIAFLSTLTRSPQGLPVRLLDTARVRGTTQGTESVTFDYAPQAPIELPR